MSERRYEYGRIQVLADKLQAAGIAEDVRGKIMEGGEQILRGTSPEKKADWLKGAMDRMDALLDEERRQCVRESCACCLGGKRLEITKGIAKKHQSFEDRFEAAKDAHYVFGHGLEMQDDGSIICSFDMLGKDHYRCVCLPKAKEPVSGTYCYCCGGHIKHHLQIALGVKASCELVSSALESGGKKPCRFRYRII